MVGAKIVCVLATVIGILIIIFPALLPMSGEVSSVISAASAVLVAIGSYFFAYIDQNQKMEKLNRRHQHNLDVLQAQLEDSGQDIFIKQSADDLIELRLIQDTLKDIFEYTNSDPINSEAIKQAVLGIKRLHFKGFLSKVGDLMSDGGRIELLERFLTHLESVLRTHTDIPASLSSEIQQLRDIIEQKKKLLPGSYEIEKNKPAKR